jgi:hypothetical protein
VLGLVGALGTGAGLLGAAHAVLLAAYPPAVAADSYSFPFPPGGFVASQIFLTARDLALAALLTGLLRTPVARTRTARLAIMAGVASFLALAALEIVSVAVGDAADSGAWYGLACFGVALGLCTAGVSAARTPMPTRGMRLLPLTIGLYVFVPLTPGILAGFTPGQLALAGWMLLFARLGRELATQSPTPHRGRGTTR